MLKRTLSFSTALAGLFASISVSSAADLLPPPPPAPVVTEIRQSDFDWTGVYLGIVGGGTCMVSGYSVTGSPDPELNGCGYEFGGVVGGNYQFGQGVVGLELDVTKGTKSASNSAPTQDVDYTINYRASARGRLGWLLTDQTMFYGTAGVSLMRGTLGAITGSGYQSQVQNLIGWSAGLGVEHAFTNNWRGRLEYLYSDYIGKSYTLCPTCIVAFDPKAFHTVRLGLTYNFGLGGL